MGKGDIVFLKSQDLVEEITHFILVGFFSGKVAWHACMRPSYDFIEFCREYEAALLGRALVQERVTLWGYHRHFPVRVFTPEVTHRIGEPSAPEKF
ncbi:hypothetical protein M3J09_011605 [Ascochyta lentis]